MGIGVGLGLADFPFSDARAFWRWVDLCEEGGVDSLWQTDRLVSRQPILECMSAMAAIAGRTQRIKFGMNVASVGLRDPLLLAKQCATIDVLSEGRLLPAFGVGSPRGPEWQVRGEAFDKGARRTNEGLEILSRLWSEETVSFEGEFYAMKDASISPRPLQDPLPLWVGGSSRAAIRRTAKWGTGWQAGGEAPEEVGPVITAIREAARAEGRPFDPEHFGTGLNTRFGSWDEPLVAKAAETQMTRTGRDPRRQWAIGAREDILARIAAFVDAGVSKFILRPMGRDDEEVMAQTRRLVEEIIPAAAARRGAA
ncbi:MAG: LLM class flavin-dependent oxidoreductase [Alphaproteobacteria bacterium]|nr:LLM class flavin-dependent oxidoreductase [Alphaproteobacteria bacterium]MCY4319247.1 LLM class flavin-dependent oxidoreductase [Alphaproteobacteria bacterium]